MKLRELEVRESNLASEDEAVTLLWGKDDAEIDHTFLQIKSQGYRDRVEVPPEQALEAFYHPAVYGLGYLAIEAA